MTISKKTSAAPNPVESTDGVTRLIEMQTVHTGEDSILLCLKVETSRLDRDYDVQTVDKVERNVRTALPWYTFEIYVEPDLYDPTRGDNRTGRTGRV